jgi:hypothetical protein
MEATIENQVHVPVSPSKLETFQLLIFIVPFLVAISFNVCIEQTQTVSFDFFSL